MNEASEEKQLSLSEFLDALPEPTMLVSRMGRICEINGLARELACYSRGQILDRPLTDLVVATSSDNVLKQVIDIVTAGMTRFQATVRRGDSRLVDVEVGAAATRIAGEIQFLISLRDLSQQRQAEQRMREVQEYQQLQIQRMPIGCIVWDTDFRVQSWNPAAEKIFGFTVQEVMGKHPYDLIVPKEAQSLVDSVWNRLIAGDMAAHSVNDNITKDGRTIVCDWVNTPLRRADGVIVGILSTVQDITERRRAENRIAHLTAVLKAVRDVNQLITREKDSERLIHGTCDLLVRNRGYEKAWVLLFEEDRTFLSFAGAGFEEKALLFEERMKVGEYPECVKELLSQSEPFLASGQPGKRHAGCVLADLHNNRGVFRHKLVHDGKPYGVLGVTVASDAMFDAEEQSLFGEVCGDIAFALANIEKEKRREQAEQRLAENERRLQTLFDTMAEGVFMASPDGNIMLSNTAAARHLGLRRSEIEGHYYADLEFSVLDVDGTPLPVEDTPFSRAVREKRQISNVAVGHKAPDGSIRWLSVSAAPLVNPDGNVVSVICTCSDVTEQKLAEERLRSSEARLAVILDAVDHGIALVDLNGTIVHTNAGAALMAGMQREELIGRSVFDMVDEKARGTVSDKMKETLARGYSGHLPVSCVRKDGSKYLAEVGATVIRGANLEPAGFVAVFEDVTERDRMQEQLIVADRLATIGELVAGIAHELNNPLTSVVGFSELCQLHPLPDEVKGNLSIVVGEAQRAARIVKNLLTFSRKHEPVRGPLSVHAVIEKVLELRGYEQRVQNIHVVTRFAENMPDVQADYFQLQQVFINIIVNAEYAMIEAHKGGTLIITTEAIGETMRVCIEDDGPGIPKEIISRLFTPFFTTKPAGKGTGLGLSICHGIVMAHGGKIYAESDVGKGTTFVIELPIAHDGGGG